MREGGEGEVKSLREDSSGKGNFGAAAAWKEKKKKEEAEVRRLKRGASLFFFSGPLSPSFGFAVSLSVSSPVTVHFQPPLLLMMSPSERS